MKTKKLLFAAGLTICMVLLTHLYSNAQIYFEGFDADHEGGAAWDADGSGPESAAVGHMHPFGWGSSRYYGASRDYDGIDPDPGAALAHLLEGMNGFPLFEQVLTNLGFSADQVKIKVGLFAAENDIEGEDWFTFNSRHYFNKYDGQYTLELDGEPMISGHFNYAFFSYDSAIYNVWLMESNFDYVWNASSSSSPPVQAAASVFFQDLNGEQLRMVFTNMTSPGSIFSGNGRIGGVFFDVSGYFEKGQAELPFIGLSLQHQGIACWDADGTGPEPAATGHTFIYNGTEYWMAYYIASLDYDRIDTDPNAALCHFIDGGKGFPNLLTQLAYRGYPIDQLKVKCGLEIMGNDEEGTDWGLNGNIHWFRHYGTPVTIEVDSEPIMEYMIDTNYSNWYLEDPMLAWESSASFSPVKNISTGASSDAQFVALSFLKDIGSQFLSTYMEGHGTSLFSGNGRTGAKHQVDNGYLTLGIRDYGTTVWPGEVSGTWNAAGSPYMIEGGIVVPDGETLAIESGAKLEFRGPFGILVNGRVNAQGSGDANIVLTHSNPAIWWDGLDYPDTPETNDSSFFSYCVFQHGYAQGEEPFNSGGAVTVKNFSKLKFTNCTFQHNKADQPGSNYNPTGGAVALWNSDPMIQNCIFRYNHSDTAAGALFAYEYSDPIISGCLFYENSSSYWAGAVGFYQNSGGILLNSTIADNIADFGGGIGFYDNSSPEIINSILWDNSALEEGDQVYLNTKDCAPGFYYNDIEGGKESFGGVPFTGDYLFNLKEDPLFHMGDTIYGILDDSPCYNSGTPDTSSWFYPQHLPAVCLCGNPRISYGKIDMGCYEFFIEGTDESEIKNDFAINIFPNPSKTDPVIEFVLEKEAPVSLSIIDLQGKVVYEKQTSILHKGINRLAWNIGNVAPGIYFCRIQAGNKVVVRKLIVQ